MMFTVMFISRCVIAIIMLAWSAVWLFVFDNVEVSATWLVGGLIISWIPIPKKPS